MLADAHIHFFANGYPRTRDLAALGGTSEVEAYEALRRTHDIATALVIGYEAEGIDPGNNAYIRKLAADRPWITTLAYVAVEGEPPQAERINALLDDGHAGITAYAPDAATGAALAAWPPDVWRILSERHAIVSLNARPEATGAIEAVVRANPACRFLFSHVGLPGRYASAPTRAEAAARIAALLALSDCPNAFVKISGLYAISEPSSAHPHDAAQPYVELVLDHFGPARCLWASDFSPALEFVSFDATADIPWIARLSASERAGIMGQNLLTLLDREDDT